MHALVLTALLGASPAHAALSGDKAGVWFDLGAGLGAGDIPFSPGIGTTIAVGGWFGRYDDDFAIGRHIGIGVRLRQDTQLHAGRRLLRFAPMVDIRRGIDLLVIHLAIGAVAGPLFEVPLDASGYALLGATARVAGEVGYRFRPHWNVGARLEAGVDIDGARLEPAMAFTIQIGFATPLAKKAP